MNSRKHNTSKPTVMAAETNITPDAVPHSTQVFDVSLPSPFPVLTPPSPPSLHPSPRSHALVIGQRVGEQSGRDGHDVVRGERLHGTQHLLAGLRVGDLR